PASASARASPSPMGRSTPVTSAASPASSRPSAVKAARLVELQDLREAAEREVVADDDREVEDLGVAEVLAERHEELVVEVEVVEREPLGVLDGELLTSRVVVTLVRVRDVRIHLLGDPVSRQRRDAPAQSYRAVVDLRDPHPHAFAFAGRQD